jgi:hypothetical protein
VRPLGIDDFDAADDPIARGVAGLPGDALVGVLDVIFACGVGALSRADTCGHRRCCRTRRARGRDRRSTP